MSYLELYHDYLLFERNLSRQTILTYENQISHFLSYLKKNNLDLENLDSSELRNYLENRRSENDSERTIALVITVLKSFYKFLNKDGYIKSNPTLQIEQIKPKKTLPSTLTVEEVESILKVIDENNIYGYRDKALFEFLFSTGARVSEAVNLTLNNINLREKTVNILGKGNKTRIGFLGEISVSILAKYLLEIRPKILEDRQSNYVFVGKKNEKLNRSYVLTILKKYAKIANINKTISPHTFRHSFATRCIEAGMKPKTLQMLFGHSNIGSTMNLYVHTTEESIRRYI